MNNKITAKVICDSVNEFGNRMTTLVTKFPRYILAELNTHRAISKNSASSRAKPFKTMLNLVNKEPFIPVQWMKDHKGMQGHDYFNNEFTEVPVTLARNPNVLNEPINEHLEFLWLNTKDSSVHMAEHLANAGLTKQIVNRVLEPFMMHEVLITATEWDNFFVLRCPRYTVKGDGNDIYQTVTEFFSRKDAISVYPEMENMTDLEWRGINTGMADIHIMDLAEAIWDAMNTNQPVELRAGEYHMPYTDDIDAGELIDLLIANDILDSDEYLHDAREDWEIVIPYLLKISAARCARISYKTFGEDSKRDLLADIRLHDALLEDQPIHASPAEHQGQAMSGDDLDDYFICEGGEVRLGVCRNLVGFKQYRTFLKNETIR